MKITIRGKINTESLQKLFAKAKSRPVFVTITEEAIQMLYKRVKSGYGVNDDMSANPRKIRLATLSDSYKQFRAGKVAFATRKIDGKKWVYSYKPMFAPRLGEFATAGKSNLTLTGKMLSSIQSRILSNGFKLYFTGKEKEKAEYVRDFYRGKTIKKSSRRPFFAFTVEEQKMIQKNYLNIMRELARSILKI